MTILFAGASQSSFKILQIPMHQIDERDIFIEVAFAQVMGAVQG